MAFGDPPSYSTRKTLALALVSIVGALATFVLGALDYAAIGRWWGLWELIVAALLLVFGVLASIRFLEAQDALGDTMPRTPMYATPHERLTFAVGLGLNTLALLVHLANMLRHELPLWHAATLLVNVWAAALAWQTRPRQQEF